MRSLLAVPLALALAGCPHQEEKKDPPPVAKATPLPPQVAEQPRESSCSADVDCKDGQLCVRGRCEDISAGLAECNQVRINFPLDSDQLDSDGTQRLQRSARCLKADRALHVTIEGDAGVGPLLTRALAAGATVIEVEPERETLEDLFVRKAMSTGD